MSITFKMAKAIVESSFAPLSCRCSQDLSSAMISIYDAATGEPHLVVVGINIDGLGTAKDVSRLVGELRYELEFYAPRLQSDTPQSIRTIPFPNRLKRFSLTSSYARSA